MLFQMNKLIIYEILKKSLNIADIIKVSIRC